MTGSDNETIAAIATPPGKAAISIVRVSGPRALEIADAVFYAPGLKPSRMRGGSFRYGHIRPGTPGAPQHAVDEAVLLVFRAPHSYTREDVVELQGHGGRACAERILSAVLNAGASPAEPGEFTRRAFLSGRIDLVQAEAVMDLIAAQSERAATSALEQLEGSLSSLLREAYNNIISICCELEVALDFSEDDVPPLCRATQMASLESVSRQIAALLATWTEGRRLREGARVVLSGRPNVGKSTLLNAMLGWSRAIVTDVPGTTRDTIEEGFVLGGYPIRLVDTAGIRESDCVIEQAGVSRARTMLGQADLILYVLDADAGIAEDEIRFVSTLPRDRLLIVWNKVDLRDPPTVAGLDEVATARCSAAQGDGLKAVMAVMAERLGIVGESEAHAAISERHRHELRIAADAVCDAVREIAQDGDMGLAPAASILRGAAEALGRTLGRSYSPDLLDQIFSRFCIGK